MATYTAKNAASNADRFWLNRVIWATSLAIPFGAEGPSRQRSVGLWRKSLLSLAAQARLAAGRKRAALGMSPGLASHAISDSESDGRRESHNGQPTPTFVSQPVVLAGDWTPMIFRSSASGPLSPSALTRQAAAPSFWNSCSSPFIR